MVITMEKKKNSETIQRNKQRSKNEDMREMKVGFVENLKKLTLTTIQHIQERQRLSKIKKSVNKEERN